MHGWIIFDKPIGARLDAGGRGGKAQFARSRIWQGQGRPWRHARSSRNGRFADRLGEATKLCGRMLDASKVYDFTIKFGDETAGWMLRERL
jgi:tRNA pseudouridine55 synthase